MRVLVADDDRSLRRASMSLLKELGHDVDAVDQLSAVSSALKSSDFDALFLDLSFPDGDARGQIARLQQENPALRIVVVTGVSDVSAVVECVRAGAYDYLVKPFTLEDFRSVTANLQRECAFAHGRAEDQPGTAESAESMLEASSSPAMREPLELIRLVAANEALPCLVTGESGAGKEVAARAIHKRSSRSSKPFVAINCAALPKDLIESELFGHARGAFTGATTRRVGLIEQAHGGTLFLDEIGDMPLEAQSKMLRVLETGKVRPVGQADEVAVDARVLAATNRPLEQMVESQQFRMDLYYRLNVVPLRLPPLRERPEDIPALAEHFLRLAAAPSRSPAPRFSDDALAELRRQPWVGNARQLRNTVLRLAMMANGGGVIDAATVKRALGATPSQPVPAPDAPARATAARPSAPATNKTIAEVEWDHILRVYESTNQNKSQTARILGISRQALIRKFKTREESDAPRDVTTNER